MAERPKLGGIFGSPASPVQERPAGLVGLLDSTPPPAAPAAVTAPTPVNAPSTSDEVIEASEKPPRSRPARQPRRAATVEPRPVPAGANKVVPVVLDASILTELRSFAARIEQTQGTVALRAIEAHADDLATYWRGGRSSSGTAGRLFGTVSTVHRRTEPGVQTQLRISEVDAATLDRLAGEWDAPSRSALVNEALRRYISAEGEGRKAV